MLTEHLRQCWFLAGPTASGKSSVSLELASRLNAEIISMDSMAVYCGMDIGTAKPSKDEQQQVPHHLIDVVRPHEEFSVTEYVALAESAAAKILAKGRVPLFVGGTGLYLRSLLRGVFEGPAADWILRQTLQRQADEFGNKWLHDELKRVDPGSAMNLHENDQRRIIRAIEVFRLTGKPLSALQTQRPLKPEHYPAATLWLDPPREWLHDRINMRVDIMIKAGLLDETRQLLRQQPPPARTARQALGYRELIAHIEEGMPLDNSIEQIKTGTRQFAKRQHTWFRNLKECTGVSTNGNEDVTTLADKLIATASQSQKSV